MNAISMKCPHVNTYRLITVIEFPLVPGPESPAKCSEPVMISFAFQVTSLRTDQVPGPGGERPENDPLQGEIIGTGTKAD